MDAESIKGDMIEVGRLALGELSDRLLGQAADTDLGREMIEDYKKKTIAQIRTEAERISLYVLGVGTVGLIAFLFLRK